VAAALLTASSVLMCPHGGSVSIIPGNVRVLAGGDPLALTSGAYPISGCPFQIPVGTGSVPHPCVTVKWLMGNHGSTVGGGQTLSAASVGVCLAADQAPQGPVTVVFAQPRVTGH